MADSRYSRAFSGPSGGGRPRVKRAYRSPSPAEVEDEYPERKSRRRGGERGAPWRRHERGEPEGSWSPSSQEGRWDPQAREEGGYWAGSPPGDTWESPPRESRRGGSWEPPSKRARSPPRGGRWRDPPSPLPKGRSWASPGGPLSITVSVAGRRHSSPSPARYDPSPPASRDRWGSPRRESRGRSRESPTRRKGPARSWRDSGSPLPPPSRRAAEWGPRGPEEPRGGTSSSSSHRSRGEPEWEARQGYLEGQRRGKGRSFQNFPQGGRGSPSREGRRREADPTARPRDWSSQEWEEEPEESRSFRAQSRPDLKERRRRPDDREPIGSEEESWAGGDGRQKCSEEERDDWGSSTKLLEEEEEDDEEGGGGGDWGHEGPREGSQGGLYIRPVKRPAPPVGWVPNEEVVNYWERCQSLLTKTVRVQFLSTCPRPTIPDRSSVIPKLNWEILNALTNRQVHRVSLATRFSFTCHCELLETLAPAMALYEMAEAAAESRQAVDPLDVQELVRRLIRYVGSLNQSLTMQRCSQVLGTIDPKLRYMTSHLSGPSDAGLLFGAEKVELLKRIIITSEEKSEVNLRNYRISDQESQIQDETRLELWHRRFGHADSKAILQLHKHNLGVTFRVNPGDIESLDRCVICLAGQGKKPSFPLKTVRTTTQLLDLVHCELCGPFTVPSWRQHRYALIFVDDFSRYCVTYLLRGAREIHKYIKMYFDMLAMLEDRRPLKAFQFNSSSEPLPSAARGFLEQEGVSYKRNADETPGQSRTAGREVASLLEMTRCMLADAHLPNPFWDSAMMAATYLLNRLPIKGCRRTPFYVWNGNMPSIGHIRVFGSLAYNRNTRHRQTPQIFIGYNLRKQGYRVMDLEKGFFSTKSFIDFDEHKIVDKRLTVLDAFEGHGGEPLIDVAGPSEPDRGEADNGTGDEGSTLDEGDGDEGSAPGDEEPDEPEEASPPACALEPSAGHSEPLPTNEPAAWEDLAAMPAAEADKWRAAAREEVEGLRKGKAWTLAELPPGKSAVGCKWVFTVEPGAGGQAERYTGRLVLLLNPEEDLRPAFVPGVKQSTIRMLLSISGSKQMQVKHLEVKAAPLPGEAAEDIYMLQPPGFVDQKHPGLVCKLKRDRYGPNRASQAWNEKLKTLLLPQGFKQDQADRCLYTRSKHGHLVFVLNCAEVLIVASQQEQDYEETVRSLRAAAEIKDLGDAARYLGSLAGKAADGSSLPK